MGTCFRRMNNIYWRKKKRLRPNVWYFHKFWEYNDVFIRYDIFTYEPIFLSRNFIKTSFLLINALAHAQFARVKVLTLTWDKILNFLCIWFHLLISKSIFNEILSKCHFKVKKNKIINSEKLFFSNFNLLFFNYWVILSRTYSYVYDVTNQ